MTIREREPIIEGGTTLYPIEGLNGDFYLRAVDAARLSLKEAGKVRFSPKEMQAFQDAQVEDNLSRLAEGDYRVFTEY